MLRKHPMIQLTVGDATSHRQHTRSSKLFKASVSMHLKQRATNKPLNLHCLTWFCWHQKFQNTWWMSKTFFLNTLGNFNFARAQKKSTPCKTHAKCPSGQHWRDFDYRSHMENPGFCLQDWQKISKEMKPSRSSWNLSLTPSLQDRLEPQLEQSFRW
jgi:hypothetical protein